MPASIRPSVRVRMAALVVALLGALTISLPSAQSAQIGTPYRGPDDMIGLDLLDARVGTVSPSAAQRAAANALGATRVSWNRFGTPDSLVKHGGFLTTGLSANAVTAARQWVSQNRTLYRLTAAEVSALELVADVKLPHSQGHVVLLQQTFGGLPAAHEGLISVSLINGKVAYVGSSIAGNQGTPAPATLSATEAWGKAAANVDLRAGLADLDRTVDRNGWTYLYVEGLSHPQMARLVALPTYTQGVKAAWEVNVIDNTNAHLQGYTSFVDARTGDVLVRVNKVNDAGMESSVAAPVAAPLLAPTTGNFSGSTGALGDCGIKHPIPVPAGTTSIDVLVTTDDPNLDLVIYLFDPTNPNPVASQDTLGSPEALHYQPGGVLTPGTWSTQVCEFVPADPPFDYTGQWLTNDAPVPGVSIYPPKWTVFPANPKLDYSSTDIRQLWCWESVVNGAPIPGCQRSLLNIASRVPWDYDVKADAPTFSSIGNNANASEAWLATQNVVGVPAEQYHYVKPDRNYTFPWTNQWFEEKCNPLTTYNSPQRNDIDAAIANLFAMHNRMHDFSYFLGFTEQTWNLQMDNFGGANSPAGENDPEFGQAQAGAIAGGPPVPGAPGRDNANQLTLQDGVPGITNMYLWQPLPAAFYAPCVDGDFDMSVIGHEYTHAISNRMVAGPNTSISGGADSQSLGLGESWSDLVGQEYLLEYGFLPVGTENPFVVGGYATGDPDSGIRNHAMNESPLNWSDIRFDGYGDVRPHDDGEIWSAINYEVRQALVAKYNAQFPATNMTLQRECADGVKSPGECPGNRRWIQLVFDAFLPLPGTPDMIDARDAMLAADVVRFGGANQTEMWRAFAKRGMGQFSSTTGNEDPDPVPSWETPLEANEGTINFDAIAVDEPGTPHVNAKIYVGVYQARVTPAADTDIDTPLSNALKLVPGTYDFIAQAPGYGEFRFQASVGANTSENLTLNLRTNRASSAKGATITGDGTNLANLIDDTEATFWTATGRVPSVAGTKFTVKLGGGAQNVKNVQVSAWHNLQAAERWSVLRQFEIWTCNGSDVACALDVNFTKIYTSPANAFPGVFPRPNVPDAIVRAFDVPDTDATHVRLVVAHNQCTAPGTPYQGDTDMDPNNNPDCDTGSVMDQTVRAAELQVFTGTSAVGGPATCTQTGTAGNDVLTGGPGPDVLCGLGGNDVLYGKGGDDTLLGGEGADVLVGAAGVDSLFGEGGNDTLRPGMDNDTVDGGAGIDGVSYEDVAGPVTVNLTTQTATGAGTDTLVSIENASGTAAADTLIGNGANNSLDGRGGVDNLQGGGGNDYLVGGPGQDSIDGGAGNDQAAYYGAPNGATVNLGAGTTSNDGYASPSTDSLVSIESAQGSNGGNDSLTGSNGPDRLFGMAGSDQLFGLGGNDYLDGGAGTDACDGGAGANQVVNCEA